MIRIALIEVLLFLLPFLIYAGWRFVVHEARGSAVIGDAPVLVLIALGLSLLAAGLFYIASYDKEGVEGHYVPAIYKDGKIVPGHFEHPDAATTATGAGPKHD
jgi:hypothetical protein